MSATNARRHGPDLKIADKDLVTGRDVRRLMNEQSAVMTEWVESTIARAIQEERDRIAAERERAWYRRVLRFFGVKP